MWTGDDHNPIKLPVPAPQPESALLAQYQSIIDRYRDMYDNDPLVPLPDIARLRRELTAPAPIEQVGVGVRQLIGCFKAGNAVPDPAQFAEAMVEELSVYPLDVLRAAAREARRNFDWLPSIAEMLRLCERAIEPRRQILRTLDRMEREHRYRIRRLEQQSRTR